MLDESTTREAYIPLFPAAILLFCGSSILLFYIDCLALGDDTLAE